MIIVIIVFESKGRFVCPLYEIITSPRNRKQNAGVVQLTHYMNYLKQWCNKGD